jgi:hypothetical protein
MDIINALKDFGITGTNGALLAALAFLVNWILKRYDTTIDATTKLAAALQAIALEIRELRGQRRD